MTLRQRTVRRIYLHVLLASAALCLVLAIPHAAVAQEDAAQQIIAMINGWRIEQGTWPLRENATLDRMANDQAAYILSLPSIPGGGDIHLDAQGANPAMRARLPQYDWPSYGDDRYTAVGEIAYVGINARAAHSFWENSTVHRNTALNPAYREIGVAALPHRFGYVYMVVLGARPDVLPAIPDLQTDTLYLSNERFSGARRPWIRNAQQVRLFDAEGRPLGTGWMPWQDEIPLPQDAGDTVYVEYSDGDSGAVLSVVLLAEAESVLPTLAPSVTPSPTPTPTAAPTRTSETRVDATPTTTLTFTPTAVAGQNVLLLYDARSFSLINTGQTSINVQEVVFVEQTQTFAASRWATDWLSGSLSALAANDCLQVWSWLENGMLEKPSRCRQRRGVLTIAPDRLFWTRGDFEVHWRDSILALCRVGDSQCEFAVP